MRTLQQWFDEYAVSHQHETNQSIHFICVPTIFFSIVGLFMSIPNNWLVQLTGIQNGLYINWAVPTLLLVLLFYIRLSFVTFLKMLLFSALCLIGNYYLGTISNLFIVSISIFVLAWIGQFYGHKLEGKKPSFLKDVQFLLIGPAWVFEKLSH